jgi:transcription antitermination factor NusG
MTSMTHCPDSASEMAEPEAQWNLPRRRWYAIRVQSRFEATASAILRGKGYEEFLPLYQSRRRWSDRVKLLDLPLFPGYLFCRFDVSGRLLPILTTPGVICIVGAGKSPIPVGEDEIAAVQAVLRSGLPSSPWPFLNVGAHVYIERGPLTGLEGIVTSADKKYRLVVSVPLLQRSVAVEIDSDWARPILQGAGPISVHEAERLRAS